MRALSLGGPAIALAFALGEQTHRAATGKPVERFVGGAETYLAIRANGSRSSGVPS